MRQGSNEQGQDVECGRLQQCTLGRRYLIARGACGKESLPDRLLCPIADHYLVGSIVQAILSLQLLADGCPQRCRANIGRVVRDALPDHRLPKNPLTQNATNTVNSVQNVLCVLSDE